MLDRFSEEHELLDFAPDRLAAMESTAAEVRHCAQGHPPHEETVRFTVSREDVSGHVTATTASAASRLTIGLLNEWVSLSAETESLTASLPTSMRVLPPTICGQALEGFRILRRADS